MFYIIVSFSTLFFSLKNWDFIQILKVKLLIELKGCFVSICVTGLMFFKSQRTPTMGQSVTGQLSRTFLQFSSQQRIMLNLVQEKSNSFH